jgi:hypothetical protein
MQGKNKGVLKKRASTPIYISPNQLTLVGYESPFKQALTKENRWVKLADVIPWDKIVHEYDLQFTSKEGRPPINGRVILGAVIIKHMLSLSDRETILQIQENMFMQYFLGYSTFTNEEPFTASLFVSIRERLNLEIVNRINEIVVAHGQELAKNNEDENKSDKGNNQIESEPVPLLTHKGKLLVDATVAPQNITYPTDLKLLNSTREKSEELIDKLYIKELHGEPKVRTYRNEARVKFLKTAKKKSNTIKELYKANGSQIRFLRRNLNHIYNLLEAYDLETPLKEKDWGYLETIITVYDQQSEKHRLKTNSIEDRIVNLHQKYIRPIVRGKQGAKVEFGSKLHVALVNGYTFIDKLAWDNFNEGQYLITSIELYKKRFGYYPAEVFADKIYCNRENRQRLKELNIQLRSKPLGRPSKEALSNQVSPGERNPIEGKFGQAKVGYGLDNIKAKLQTTSESWIASIILVINLVNLTRLAPPYIYIIIVNIWRKYFERRSLALS